VSVNYDRVHFAGSVIIGIIIALAPTVLLYRVGTRKIGAFIFFLPAAFLATWLVRWSHNQVIKIHADTVRRRYKAGRPAEGK
jgi:hypothetical protein